MKSVLLSNNKHGNTADGSTPTRRRSDLTYTKLSMHNSNIENNRPTLDNNNNNINIVNSEDDDDLRPTPRTSFDMTNGSGKKEIEVDFSYAYDAKGRDDDELFGRNNSPNSKISNSISSGIDIMLNRPSLDNSAKKKKMVTVSSEDPIVFDSNPLQASPLSRDAVDDYRHKVALAKEEKRLELERKKRKEQAEKEARLKAAAERRLKAEEEARIAEEKEREEARVAKEAEDAAQAALDESDDYINNKNIHDKPPTPIKGTTALAGVGGALYTGLGIGIVANIITKPSRKSSPSAPDRIVEPFGIDSDNEKEDNGAWHDNYENLIVKDDYVEREVFDEAAVENNDFNAEIGRQIENDRKMAEEREEELRLATIQREEELKLAALQEEEDKIKREREAEEEDKKRKEREAAEEDKKRKEREAAEEDKKRQEREAARLEYTRKLEEKRKIKKRDSLSASLESAREEAKTRLEEFTKIEAIKKAEREQAEAEEARKKKEKEEEMPRAVVNLNKHFLNPLTTAILTAIDFVDYKSKLDIAAKLAQKMESDIIGTNVFDFDEGKKDLGEEAEARLKALTEEKEAAFKAEQEVVRLTALSNEEQERLKAREEARLKELADEDARLKALAEEGEESKNLVIETPPMPENPRKSVVPFVVDPSYSEEDIEVLLALYNVLCSGFEVTKRSTKGQLQKRKLHCDNTMLYLSWKEVGNGRRRSSVTSMFSSKKNEDERLLDFQSIFGVTADPKEKKVTVSHPARVLEIMLESSAHCELLVNGLSVYAKHNKKSSSSSTSTSLNSSPSTTY